MLYIRGSDFDGRLLQPNLQLILPLLPWLLRFSELQPLNPGLHHSGPDGFLLGGRKELLTTQVPFPRWHL